MLAAHVLRQPLKFVVKALDVVTDRGHDALLLAILLVKEALLLPALVIKDLRKGAVSELASSFLVDLVRLEGVR